MSETNKSTETVEANWDALTSSQEFGDATPKQEEKQEEVITKDVDETPEQVAEKTAETEKAVADALALEETNKAALAEEAKALNLPETSTKEEIEAAKLAATADELTLDEESDAPIVYPENSFKAIAQKLGADIKEDTAEAFKEVYITKAEAEKQAQVSKETYFANLDPKVAAALEMKELGVPDHLLLEPTKEIEGYLKLDDVELVRAELATIPNWTNEMIDKEIEDLIESGKIDHSAAKIRVELNNQKEAMALEHTNIIQKYTAQKQKAADEKKALERTETINELGKIQEIAGVKIPKKVMDALITKYTNGVYDKELSSASSRAEYIVKRELEAKAVAHIKNKVSEKAKADHTNKLLNIPTVKTAGGGSKQPTNTETDNWTALDKEFGN